MKLHIFNPETDYALAQGRKPYTPPKPIVALRRRLALLPRVFAAPDDLLLVDDASDYPPTADIIDWKTLPSVASKIDGVEPWGWNHTLRRQLLAAGVDSSIMPSDEQLDCWRELSHRRISIRFNEMLGHNPLPSELFSLDEAKEWMRKHPDTFFKAPWSSSGRGVLHAHAESDHWQGWVEGIIGRQGSVMAEVAVEKKLDFATEWYVGDTGMEFVAFSVFQADSKGNYMANEPKSQKELRAIIEGALAEGIDLDAVVEQQRNVGSNLLTSGECNGYRGYAGIDMMVTADGSIVPCVEVNLRRTMGLVSAFAHAKNYLSERKDLCNYRCRGCSRRYI